MSPPWFSRPGLWRRDPRVMELRAQLGLADTALANLLFESIAGWCTEQQTPTIPRSAIEQEARAWGMTLAMRDRCLEGLVGCGLLRGPSDEDAFALVDEDMIRRRGPAREGDEGSAPASGPKRATGPTARQQRWRDGRRAKKAASTGASKASTDRLPVDAPPSTPRLQVDASTVDGGASTDRRQQASTVDSPAPTLSPPDPPPAPAPTPAQAQAQAREGGAPSAAPAPSSVGEIPEILPSETPQAPRSKAPAKPKAPRALPPRAALAKAYSAGISQATGAPCSPPSERWELDALEAMASAHAAGRLGAELLGWLSEQAEGFAAAKAGDAFLASKGFAPKLCLSWLNGGAEGRPLPARPAPPPPRILPHPRRPTPSAPSALPEAPRVPAAQALAGALHLLGGLDGGFEGPPPRASLPAPRPLSPAERAELIAKQRAQLAAVQQLPSLPQPQEPSA